MIDEKRIKALEDSVESLAHESEMAITYESNKLSEENKKIIESIDIMNSKLSKLWDKHKKESEKYKWQKYDETISHPTKLFGVRVRGHEFLLKDVRYIGFDDKNNIVIQFDDSHRLIAIHCGLVAQVLLERT